MTAAAPYHPQHLRVLEQTFDRAVKDVFPPLSPDQRKRAIEMILLHLPQLRHVAQELSTSRLESCLALLYDEVCPHCPARAPNESCELRRLKACFLYTNVDLAMRVVMDLPQETVQNLTPATT